MIAEIISFIAGAGLASVIIGPYNGNKQILFCFWLRQGQHVTICKNQITKGNVNGG